MKKVVITSAEAKRLDARVFNKYGVSTLILMENAGRSTAEEAKSMLVSGKGQVSVLCGKGNNGGDGLVAARHLLAKDVFVRVFLVSGNSPMREEAAINLEILKKLKVKIFQVKENNLGAVKNSLKSADLIIDGLLGIGAQGQLQGVLRKIIDMVNNLKVPVLSIDIPSGLDADTGLILGVSIKADRTVTFVAKKQGMALRRGREYCGKVVVTDLGIPLL